jgi:hypothetical protein
MHAAFLLVLLNFLKLLLGKTSMSLENLSLSPILGISYLLPCCLEENTKHNREALPM